MDKLNDGVYYKIIIVRDGRIFIVRDGRIFYESLPKELAPLCAKFSECILMDAVGNDFNTTEDNK